MSFIFSCRESLSKLPPFVGSGYESMYSCACVIVDGSLWCSDILMYENRLLNLLRKCFRNVRMCYVYNFSILSI